MEHFVSGSCKGVACRMCGKQATHKVGEEIPYDDPAQVRADDVRFSSDAPMRHNLTAYVCCDDFKKIVGPAATKWVGCP